MKHHKNALSLIYEIEIENICKFIDWNIVSQMLKWQHLDILIMKNGNILIQFVIKKINDTK